MKARVQKKFIASPTARKKRPARRGQKPAALLIADLKWTRKEARETRSRLSSFEHEWERRDMEAYDRL